MRIHGTLLLENPQAAFNKVQMELQHPWAIAFYLIGIVAASWHFSYGLYLFAAKWGITVSERSRKGFGLVCTGIAITFIAVGLATMGAFFRTQWLNTPEKPPAAQQVVENGH
jgi:succinate dehydrogenase / fumarate reductase cytochrome b subunit